MIRGQLKTQVEIILKKYPDASNCDKFLTVKLWENFQKNKIIYSQSGVPVVKLESILELPSIDGISRIRRKFNEAGKYLPTDPDVRKKRKVAEEDWINWNQNTQY